MNDQCQYLFTVIIPVYNTKDYLEDCFQSVLSQDYGNYEIIIIDDGSTDGSSTICDLYMHKFPHIKVIHQENQGLSIARNIGLQNANGKYIVFLDSDDMLSIDSMMNLEKAIEKYNYPDVVVSRRETYTEANKVPCLYYFDEMLLCSQKNYDKYCTFQNLPDCWLGVWIFTVSKTYIERNQLYFYPGIFHEDEEWVPRLILNTESIGLNNEFLYCNRINRKGSITSTLNIKRLFDKLLIVDLLIKEFSRQQYTEKGRNIVQQRTCKMVFGVLMQSSAYCKNIRYKELMCELKKKIWLLKVSKKWYHRLIYIVCHILGYKSCSKILNLLRL